MDLGRPQQPVRVTCPSHPHLGTGGWRGGAMVEGGGWGWRGRTYGGRWRVEGDDLWWKVEVGGWRVEGDDL